MANITSKVMTITPEVALEMLKANTRNRPLNKRQVVYYADQMVRGQWRLNGEPIIISNGNVLLDGQHRLAAIVKSQTTQDILVVKGVDGDTFSTIDTGKVRTKSDVFALEGIKDYTSISTGINAYMKLCKGMYSAHNTSTTLITSTDALDEFYAHKELYIAINKSSASCYRKIRLLKQATIFGYMAYLILEKKHNEDKVYSFFNQLFGIDAIENTSISYLRDKLLQNISGQYKMTKILQTSLVVKAWNDYVKGMQHKVLSWNADKEPMPEFI